MRDLAARSLERRFSAFQNVDFAPPARGWLRAVREALGMTSRQLADRLGVAPSRIIALEKAELSGATSLQSLRKAAAAMDCVVIYAIAPRRPIEEMRRGRAAALAEQDFDRLSHTMRLEDQELDEADRASERERLIKDYLAGPPQRLWRIP